MSDLVSKSVLKSLILDKYPTRDIEGIRDGILNIISRAPRAERRVKGEWESTEYSGGKYIGICSLCGTEQRIGNFCQNCGANMKGK